uniref:Putative reverse-transcriptase protein n=1 Tax=Volvox carteri f. nagariensis TaxID=3068 RepID=D0VMZ3_VOLCA|nr:putative reverse-transcriptase protein [Volvox carteri f. nagariensis]
MNSTMSILTTTDNITWNKVRWHDVKRRVLRMQHRIFKAKRNGKQKTVTGLQIRLINSLDAKLLSVLQVTALNKGRKTPGVDKQIVIAGPDKLRMAKELRLDGTAKPIRRVWLPKPGKDEKRPLGIPTIEDRAKQNLAKLALEPEWEAIFEPNSYGFRPGRSCHDAIEAIFLNLRHKKTKFIYDADIRKCFDRIDHGALIAKLNTFPQMERQIYAWLKAGIMEGYANAPKSYEPESNLGTPQGGIISPLLANIALHGLENHLKEFCATKVSNEIFQTRNRSQESKRKACGVIRYADDFVIIHENKQVIELCVTETKNWLQHIGLDINNEKSKLRDSREGFKFLGLQIILIRRGKMDGQGYRIKITPSKKNQSSLLEKVRKVIQNNRAISSYELIRILRPILIGWGNSFRYSECKDVFQRLDNKIYGMIRAWVFRRDTRNKRTEIKQRYFPSGQSYLFNGRTYRDNWTLVGQTKTKKNKIIKNFLPHLNWIESTKHVKILGDSSPFDGNHVYWTKRIEKYSGYPPSICKLMRKQKYICPMCKTHFQTDDRLEIDHIIPKSEGGSDKYDNLQLLHKICHVTKTRAQKGLINIVDNDAVKSDLNSLNANESEDEI